MFGTIIKDSYSKDEMQYLAEAIEETCSPLDTYGWSSAGVYCFWDYYTSEVYFLGLAIDLAERFRQHNGLIKTKDSACKNKNILEYFGGKERFGYSIFVQSSLNQPKTYRNDKIIRMFFELTNEDIIPYFPGAESVKLLKILEGMLIKSYRRYFAKLPK